MIANIEKLLELNNRLRIRASALNFAMGAATSQPGERLERVVRRADAAMYEAKRAHNAPSCNDGVAERMAGK